MSSFSRKREKGVHGVAAMTSDTIGFLGLGRLGLPVATNLLEAGHQLTVWNRSPEKLIRW